MTFWGKKFGAGAPTSSSLGQVPRPTQVPAHLMPQGMAGRQQAAVQHYANQLPAFQEQPYDGWQPKVSPKWIEDELPIWHWRGNARGAAGEDIGPCPNCGSPHFFSRREGSIMSQTGQSMAPAPHCFECGYPRQQGDLGPAAVTGAAQTAKQADAPAPSGSLAALGAAALGAGPSH